MVKISKYSQYVSVVSLSIVSCFNFEFFFPMFNSCLLLWLRFSSVFDWLPALGLENLSLACLPVCCLRYFEWLIHVLWTSKSDDWMRVTAGLFAFQLYPFVFTPLMKFNCSHFHHSQSKLKANELQLCVLSDAVRKCFQFIIIAELYDRLRCHFYHVPSRWFNS